MSDLTEQEQYWDETWQEILYQNGVDITVDREVRESISKDFALNASVQSDYMAPIEGDSEVEKLKLQIKKLESRVPCTACGGRGGQTILIGSHSSWDRCCKCSGKAWIQD
jgi:DnaJ-class molecular chaperone